MERPMLCWIAALSLYVAALVQPFHPVTVVAQEAAAAPASALSDGEIEKFLKEARVGRTKSAGKGVTNSLRATLTDDTLTHDAQIQVIDEKKTSGPSAKGTELNFRDSWAFNVG